MTESGEISGPCAWGKGEKTRPDLGKPNAVENKGWMPCFWGPWMGGGGGAGEVSGTQGREIADNLSFLPVHSNPDRSLKQWFRVWSEDYLTRASVKKIVISTLQGWCEITGKGCKVPAHTGVHFQSRVMAFIRLPWGLDLPRNEIQISASCWRHEGGTFPLG